MRPFVPNIGFVELMDSLDQSVVYESPNVLTVKNNNKKNSRRKEDTHTEDVLSSLPLPTASLLDFSNYAPINNNILHQQQEDLESFPPPPSPSFLMTQLPPPQILPPPPPPPPQLHHAQISPQPPPPPFQARGAQPPPSPPFQVKNTSQWQTPQPPQSGAFNQQPAPPAFHQPPSQSHTPQPPSPPLQPPTNNQNQQNQQNLIVQPQNGQRQRINSTRRRNNELLQSIRKGKQLRKTSASVKERVVQLKLSKQVENTLQKAHNLRSQAWFQNQINGIREHTILTSDEDCDGDWSEDEWDKK